MCGIVGVVCKENLGKLLFQSIKRLEYRGYDSVGMASLKNGVITIRKDTGNVVEVNSKLNLQELEGNLGLAHTRWATNGKVSRSNAHPHQSCDKHTVIVHNGIIENNEEIKKNLIKKGHRFESETDSEVIAHYFEEKLKEKPIKEAIKDFFKDIRGTFAILLLKSNEEKMYALKKDSPLVLGICANKFILASDIYCFSDKTNKAIFFDNNEFAIIDKNSYSFYDVEGKKIKKDVTSFEWNQAESLKKEYRHFMIKEILEEPYVVERLLLSLKTEQSQNFKKLVDLMKNSKKILFTAAGTSYNASLLGVFFLNRCGIEAQAIVASEFKTALLDNESLVIAMTQSGETMDVVDALKYAESKNAKVASIVNVPYSTIRRMSSLSLNIVAGQEICVAATKSFVNQVVLLLKIAEEFGFHVDLFNLSKQISHIFEQEDKIKEIAKQISKEKDIYVVGRGINYGVAMEIALKIKEISYIHAEGMMGGELKHGTLALIEKGTPVIALIGNKDDAMLSNTKEMQSRGAKLIKISNEFKSDIKINTIDEGEFSILATIVGQMLTYYIALEKNLPIDKPRNLAKSVTVL